MVVIKSPLESAVWSIVGGDIENNEKTSNSWTNFINVQKIMKNKMAPEDLWKSY